MDKKVNLIFSGTAFFTRFSSCFFILFDMTSVNTIKVFDKNRQELYYYKESNALYTVTGSPFGSAYDLPAFLDF